VKNDTAPVRAHRVPLFWLVVALPLASVVAGIATLVLAMQGPDAALSESATRVAQMQTRDLTPDLAALAVGISGELRTQRATGAFELSTTNAGTGAPLELTLRHPGDATRDRVLVLREIAKDRYVAAGEPLPAGAWNLELRPSGAAWLVVGRLEADSTTAGLASRLAAGTSQ